MSRDPAVDLAVSMAQRLQAFSKTAAANQAVIKPVIDDHAAAMTKVAAISQQLMESGIIPSSRRSEIESNLGKHAAALDYVGNLIELLVEHKKTAAASGQTEGVASPRPSSIGKSAESRAFMPDSERAPYL